MPQPTWRDAVFSIKSFGAAMLALYIAFRAGLAQPSWSMMTAFVVAQPIAGMVAAKSLFRVVGTFVGAAMALVLVGLFDQAPILFLVALALWIGLCTFTSVLLRDAPASYGAVLSGYTAAIVGLPAALAPETAFDYAAGRCVEITLGIGCATLVSQIVFPRSAGDALKASVNGTLAAAARWVGDMVRGESRPDRMLADQRSLIADVIALDALRVFSTFDTPSVRAAGDVARHLQGRLLALQAILVSINDRVGLLRSHATAKLEVLQPILDGVGRIFDREDPLRTDADLDAAVRDIEGQIAARLPALDDMLRDPENILVRNTLLRLRDVIETWQRILVMRASLFSGRPIRMPEPAPSTARYRDVTLALVAAGVSATAVLASSAFWIATAWPNGSTAVIFAGVLCSILGSLDDPVPSAENFLNMTVLSALVAAVYLFAVYPLIDDFASLVVVMLPLFLPFGVLLALPRVGTQVSPLGLNLVAFLGLSNTGQQTDFDTFLNTASALLIGIAFGILAFRLLRPLGVEWTTRRIRRGIMRDLQVLSLAGPGTRASDPKVESTFGLDPMLPSSEVASYGTESRVHFSAQSARRERFASRMLDRINALFSRVDIARPEQQEMMRGALTALRIGFNVLALQSAQGSLPPAAAQAVGEALAGLGRHFRHLKNGRRGLAPPDLDHALRALIDDPSPATVDALTSLVAIGTALDRHQEFFGMTRLYTLHAALGEEKVPA